MKLPLSLIKQYVEIELSPKEIANKLTLAGLEVDGIENEEPSFSIDVIVGIVEKISPHPSADKLKIATVFDGNKHLQIVCGAPNCKEGMKVALAPIGSTLLDEQKKPYTIKKASLRGVESFGMLCSAKELQLPHDQDGILDLPQEFQLGESISKLFLDTVFEISLTPNLGHCLSALGIARELSALTQKPLRIPPFFLQENGKPTEKEVHISIENSKHCPKYCCRLLKNVNVQPSPFWLKNTLESIGIRSINAIVDAINYTMIECGIPMHGFDFEKLSSNEIAVRLSRENEKITTLDEEERNLPAGVLLITDGKKPIAIAGIMGGLETSIQSSTCQILLEGAFFDPMIIRKGSKKVQLRSDSSLRFEKGVDPNGISYALDRAAALIQTLCGGDVFEGIVQKEEKPFLPKEIICRLERIKKLLGHPFSLGEVESIFERLGFSIQEREKEKIKVSVPAYRHDILSEIDLVEEVARIYGYNHFEAKVPLCTTSLIPDGSQYLWNEKIRSKLVQAELQEWITPDLISSKHIDLFIQPEKKIEVLQSKSIDYSILRPSLLPSFLVVVKNNQDKKNEDLFSFELGQVYSKEGKQFVETSSIAVLIKGKNHPYHWEPKPIAVDFFDLKGILENLFCSLGITSYHWIPSSHLSFQEGLQASIQVGDTSLGICGAVNPDLLSSYDIKDKVFFAELNSELLYKEKKSHVTFKPLPQFPATERDWTLAWEQNVPIEAFFDAVKKTPSSVLETVFLLDIYEKSLQEKNVTFRFVYRDNCKTLTFEEVEKEHAKITMEIEKYLKSIRS